MKTFPFVPGLLLLITGSIWFLQGINLLPGSFMTGQTRWAIMGGICIVLGVVLLLGWRSGSG